MSLAQESENSQFRSFSRSYKPGVIKVEHPPGRTSADILKSGGYKISALDVEKYLLQHPDIEECVVVGVPDQEWGERVAAVVVFKQGAKVSSNSSRERGTYSVFSFDQ